MTRLRAILAVLVLSLAAGCSSDSDADESVDTPVDVDSVRSVTATEMAEIDSVAFTIELEGADVFIDDDELIEFQGAEGRFAAPGSADAVVSVVALGLATEVGAVAIDGDVWITNPLTGAWESAPESLSFNPATIFDGEVGLPALIADGLVDSSLESTEPSADGRWHISAGVDPARVATLTSGLVDDVDEVDLWIDADTNRLDELTFDVGTGEEGTNWRLSFDDYNASVTVNEPELG